MDTSSRKKASGGLGFSGRGGSLTIRDQIHNHDRRQCNRLGCSTRFESSSNPKIQKPERPRDTFRSTCSKALTGGSRSSTLDLTLKKPHLGREGRTSLRASVIGQSSREPLEILDSNSDRGIEVKEDPESPITTAFAIQSSSPNSDDSTDRSCARRNSSNSRSRKPISRRPIICEQNTSSSTSFIRSPTYRSNVHSAKPVSRGLKNLGCASISDILPSGCSTSDFSRTKRLEVGRKRDSECESSSLGRKPSSRMSGAELATKRRNQSSIPSPAGSPLQDSTRIKRQSASRDNAVSVSRSPCSREMKTRISVTGDSVALANTEHTIIPQQRQPRVSIPVAVSSISSRLGMVEHSLGSSNHTARSRFSSRNGGLRRQIFPSTLQSRDGRFLNMEGVAEVLLTLDRIEQYEELTHEQLSVLESNLVFAGLNLFDQHRDMRMDIDNMSYEELLALEEKMGTVSTALSEEALEKCLRRIIYMPGSRLPAIGPAPHGDDVKCSICQEEYSVGDEVGKLGCKHRYHVACIHQWLRLKNWCPICKSAACPTD